jgi:hypothetical protein
MQPVMRHDVNFRNGAAEVQEKPVLDQHTAFEAAIAEAASLAFGLHRTLGVMTVWEGGLPTPQKLHLFIGYHWRHRWAFKERRPAIEAAVRQYIGPLPIVIKPIGSKMLRIIGQLQTAEEEKARARR